MDRNSINRIKKTLACSDDQAKKVMEYIVGAGIKLPIEEAGKEGDKILLITADRKKYSVEVNSRFSVMSIKDIDAGKYVFTVFQ